MPCPGSRTHQPAPRNSHPKPLDHADAPLGAMGVARAARTPDSLVAAAHKRTRKIPRATKSQPDSPISEGTASAGLWPRLPISSELRFGMNSRVTPASTVGSRKCLPIASLAEIVPRLVEL